MQASPRHLALGLILLVLTLTPVTANIYEFTITGGEEVCLSGFFAKGAQASLVFQSYRLTKDHQNEEISDLTQAGVLEKRKGTVKVALKVESVSGIIYTAVSKTDQKKIFKAKESEVVNLCFKNQETVVAFVIFDLRTGVNAKDLSAIPTGNDTQAFMEKLEGIRMRLDNSLSLYRQMEAYEEKHLSSSNTVLSGVLLVSQIMIAVIALVGWGITILLEKSLKYKKIV
jgi:hypothetical protein